MVARPRLQQLLMTTASRCHIPDAAAANLLVHGMGAEASQLPAFLINFSHLLFGLQMWRYEGSNTLAYYLRRRDTLKALARDLDVSEDIVVPVAMRQLLLGLAALHAAGLVHR